ncbi:MAG: hypothetical protein IPM51_06310 [Sphingobacteriaceae bacterium]|nr:hypothetical protein [Sphingobacteriaceae bacterium]
MRKSILAFLIVATAISSYAQPRGKKPVMAPILADGYYIGNKGDTVKGEIQTNPDDELDLYKSIMFKKKGPGKLAVVDSRKAKGYGFSGRHFTMVPYDSESNVYIERLVDGRLKFYEFRYPDKKNGEEIISASYYVQDSGADDKEAELRELKPLNNNFYKKELKPYMKAQPMTWNDLDKFTFVRAQVVNAIKEFNKFYETTAPAAED